MSESLDYDQSHDVEVTDSDQECIERIFEALSYILPGLTSVLCPSVINTAPPGPQAW